MSQALIRESIETLKVFFRHPLEEVARLPDWSWKRTFFTLATIAALSGFLAGLFPPGVWKLLQGLILFPILVTVMSSLLASFLYYYFQIFERRTVSFARLFTLVAFSLFPFFLFHIASSFFPPSDLFGLAMMAILLVVGLTENFGLEKKRSLRLIIVVFGLLFALWLMERVSVRNLVSSGVTTTL
ncbi:MAG: YIP1 family protein [Bdellovibrionaceae bacterium]|nr:YIP1 family protein [Pseudobdellovibrionaceae bacterium]MBX3033446.1 YIP1 family protein [Pseudobdellovibrionaceae bacterium]